jgi:hypothetical protein
MSTRSATVATAIALTVSIAACLACAADPTVQVTGKVIDVNGQTEIPLGLFGVHAYGFTAEQAKQIGIECYRGIHFGPGSGTLHVRKGKPQPQYADLAVVIDCQGDRYMYPLVLTLGGKHAERFAAMGKAYGENMKNHGLDGYVEFWNEPYLNWASRTHEGRGSSYAAKYYDVSKAVDGGKVTIKGWDEPLEHMRWRKLWAKGEDGKIYYGVKLPEGAEPGDTFTGASPSDWYWTDRKRQKFTVVEKWSVHDPSTPHWWSGKQNLQFYLWMFLPFAEAVKQANPDVKVVGGWDYGYSHGDWDVFTILYAPMIDASIQWLDGLTDHHYGVNTRAVTGWYEVGTAYAMSKHGKWLRNYNTECAGYLDPAVHGGSAGDKTAFAAATYMTRDIMELLSRCPAKVGSRTTHHPNEGEFATLRYFKDLRGLMVQSASTDDDIWAIASLDRDRLVVMVFNNRTEDAEFTLNVDAPNNTTFTGGWSEWMEPEGSRRIDTKVRKFSASGRKLTLPSNLKARHVIKYVLNLRGSADTAPAVARKQYFAREGVLHKLDKGESVKLTIPAADLGHRRDNARLRIVTTGNTVGAGLRLNGKTIAMPHRPWTTDISIDGPQLKAVNEVQVTAGATSAFRLCSVSILVDGPAK